jgi:hypothetical protein
MPFYRTGQKSNPFALEVAHNQELRELERGNPVADALCWFSPRLWSFSAPRPPHSVKDVSSPALAARRLS